MMYPEPSSARWAEVLPCPRCGAIHTARWRSSRVGFSAVGALAGGLQGWLRRSTAAAAGAQVGRLLGSAAGPIGQAVGVAGGVVLGAVVGAATGLAIGNSLGHMVDSNILGRYRCLRCGHRFNDDAQATTSPSEMHWGRMPHEEVPDPDDFGA